MKEVEKPKKGNPVAKELTNNLLFRRKRIVKMKKGKGAYSRKGQKPLFDILRLIFTSYLCYKQTYC
ncbi:hypothetical protein phiOC_p093 [Ochrobactrum phage vB_OspM_OC]|nr:hypothetical protein phiOC_p093 [Ochrobactrum phage vB_OspM_OC]